MLRLFVFILGTGFLQTAAKGPVVLNWMQLQRVDSRPVTLPGVEGSLPVAVFPAAISAYNGKTVEIDGFVIPLDKTGKTLALSAYAMAECFFCGKAGPASVMTVVLRKPNKAYKTDQLATFRGILRLNDSNPKELFYVLEDAYEVKN